MADFDFFDGWGGQRDPDGVADALDEQDAEGDGGFDGALEAWSGFGDTEVQGVVAARSELAVGGNHDERVVVFDTDFDVGEVVFFEQGAFPQSGFDQCLRGGAAVFGQESGVQGAGVDPDTDRHTSVGGGEGDLFDFVVEFFDVAGVDADGGAAGVDGGEDVSGLKVNVSDDRDL